MKNLPDFLENPKNTIKSWHTLISKTKNKINPKKIKGQTINMSVLFDGGEVIYKPFSNKYFSVSMAARQPAAAAVIAWR